MIMVKDNSIRYKMLSIHFDRINITSHFESNRGSRRSIQVIDEVDSSFTVNNSSCSSSCLEPIKKEIKYTTEGKLSKQTQSKLSKAIRYINFITDQKTASHPSIKNSLRFKLVFVTLTLSSPQVHTDNELKSKLLNQLFVELKSKYHVKHYVWRCEKQANGNCHFHIVLDSFIPHDELRLLWNRLQNKLGYVDRYSERMRQLSFKDYCLLFKANKKFSKEDTRKMWIKGKSSNWLYPNSTDIHSLQFINNIDKYLIKYMSKEDQNKDIEGRLWGLSHTLSNLTGAREIMDSTLSNEIQIIRDSGYCHSFSSDYFEILYFDIMVLEHLRCFLILDLYREWLKTKFL
jgi:hypothetical protein